jgi:hypothetical protein
VISYSATVVRNQAARRTHTILWLAYNVQRLATRRQARMPTGHVPHHLSDAHTFQRAISAVYPGAREARGGANRIVN